MSSKSYIFLLFLLLCLTLGLRVIYINQIQPSLLFDSGNFWNRTLQVRDMLCVDLSFCKPLDIDSISEFKPFQVSLLERNGISILIMGAFFTIVEATPSLIYFIFTITECIVVLMIIDITLRIGGNRPIALLSGLLYALYIPTIMGTGTYLQQPILRFYLIVYAWSLVFAITTSSQKLATISVILSGCVAVLFGYTSLTTRPMMWLLLLVSILLLYKCVKQSSIYRIPIVVIFVTIMGVFITANLASSNKLSKYDNHETTSILLTGLTPSGSANSLTTVRSTPNYWFPAEYKSYNLNRSTSLTNDIFENPIEFASLLMYSAYYNWFYPDYLYKHEFILTLDQQELQHRLLMSVAIIGMIASFMPQRNQLVYSLSIFVLMGVITAIYSIISVEPRRMTIFIPYMCIYGAYGMVIIYRIFKKYTWVRRIIGLLIGGAIYLLPVSWWLIIVRTDPMIVNYLIIIMRLGVLIAITRYLVRYFDLHYVTYIALGGLLIPLVAGHILLSEWSQWTTTIDSPIRVDINDFEISDDLSYWVLIDLENDADSQSLSISVNDQIIKPFGESMITWEVGVPAVSSPYYALIENANVTPSRDLWIAYPLDKNNLTSNEVIIKVTPDSPIRIRGDYISDLFAGDSYWGPILSPFIDGNSLRKWASTSTGPRIWAYQQLDEDYTSYYEVNEGLSGDDLSADFGIQSGRYRVYLVAMPFGANTNGFTSGAYNQYSTCQKQDDFMLRVCFTDEWDVQYKIDGKDVAITQHISIQKDFDGFEQVEVTNLSDDYTIKTIHAFEDQLFFANVYDNGGVLLESYIFRYFG